MMNYKSKCMNLLCLVTMIFVSGALIKPSTAGAQQQSPAAAQRVIQTITAAQLKTLMERQGYTVEIDADGAILCEIDGYRTWMFVANDRKSLQFFVAFENDGTNLARVNEWNRTRKYGRSYLNNNGDPRFEKDLNLDGGVTVARIQSYLRSCQLLFTAWRRLVL